MTIEKRRLKLIITEVKPIQEIGAKKIPKLPFLAKVGDENPTAYFTFTRSLFEYVKAGTIIDADVETLRRESSDPLRPWIDQKVIQIYKDGQPVGGQSKTPWSGGSREDSPEKRASIERQTCLNAAVAIWRPYLELQSPGWSLSPHEILHTAQTFYDWVSGKSVIASDAKSQPARDVIPAKDTLFLPEDGKIVAPKTSESMAAKSQEEVTQPAAESTIKFANAGEFWTKVFALGYKSKVEVAKALGVKDVALIGDLEAAYATLLVLKGK